LWLQKKSLPLKSLWMFLPAALGSIALPLWVIPKASNPLTASELLPSALANPHLVPWTNGIFWTWGLPSMLGVFGLGFLAARHFKNTFPKAVPFFWANVITVCLAAAAHWAFVKIQFLPGILLCPLRITVLNSLFLISLGFQYLLDLLQSRNWKLIFIVSIFIFLFLFSERGLFWGPLAALLILSFSQRPEKSLPIAFKLCFFWTILFIFAGAPLRILFNGDISGTVRSSLAPAFSLTQFQIAYALLASGVLSCLSLWKRSSSQWAMGLALVFGMSAGLSKCFTIGHASLEGPLQSRWELQAWAKANTPPQSVFLIGWDPWRGISERQAVVIGYAKNRILPYFKFRDPLIHQETVAAVYEKHGVTEMGELPQSAILELASLFQAHYLVGHSQWKRLDFPIAFENRDWRIYSLTTSLEGQAS